VAPHFAGSRGNFTLSAGYSNEREVLMGDQPYGIDMPTSQELVAHGRSIEEIREIIGCDALIYQDVDAMKTAVAQARVNAAGSLSDFDASCFDGVYVTGDISIDDITRLNETRLQVEEGDDDNSRLALPNASV
jgi:amidophosphoribosyltransferase